MNEKTLTNKINSQCDDVKEGLNGQYSNSYWNEQLASDEIRKAAEQMMDQAMQKKKAKDRKARLIGYPILIAAFCLGLWMMPHAMIDAGFADPKRYPETSKQLEKLVETQQSNNANMQDIMQATKDTYESYAAETSKEKVTEIPLANGGVATYSNVRQLAAENTKIIVCEKITDESKFLSDYKLYCNEIEVNMKSSDGVRLIEHDIKITKEEHGAGTRLQDVEFSIDGIIYTGIVSNRYIDKLPLIGDDVITLFAVEKEIYSAINEFEWQYINELLDEVVYLVGSMKIGTVDQIEKILDKDKGAAKDVFIKVDVCNEILTMYTNMCVNNKKITLRDVEKIYTLVGLESALKYTDGKVTTSEIIKDNIPKLQK